MPQVDLETLVSACAGGSMDRRIACETQANGEVNKEAGDHEPEIPPDFPPESFWLSKDAELDWFDRNAFFERKDSQRGHSTNLNPSVNPGSNSNSNSQRFSKNLKSKAAIFSLPKSQKACFVDAKNRKHCKATTKARLFPKRSGSTGKSDGPMIEPSSPKVSCIGRVRSKRDRKRRSQKNRPSSAPKLAEPVERKQTGFFASFRAIFRSGCRERPVRTSSRHGSGEWTQVTAPPNMRRSAWSRDFDAPSLETLPRSSVESDAPGLGGLSRFASGRRSASYMDDVA